MMEGLMISSAISFHWILCHTVTQIEYAELLSSTCKLKHN